MSEDLQIAHACPHYIRYERVGIQNEIHLIPASPINGSGLVEIFRDGVLLGSNGNIRESVITTPNVSPFRVKSTTNVLTVKTTEGEENTLTLTPKIYNSATLVQEIKGKIGSVVVKESSNKSIIFTDNKLGIGFTLTGTLLKALGYTKLKQTIKTKKITPSWSLSSSLTGYDIIFSEGVRPEGLLEISYTTEKAYCRRCGGTGVENDFRFNEFGETQKIKNTDLLYQNVAKILLTEIGSNPYHDWYGSNAFRLIGQKNNSTLAESLRISVQQALTKFQSVQQQLSKVQEISDEERLISVNSVSVSQINGNATSVVCNVVVISGANKPVSVNIIFSVPGSISLDGDLT
jgi:phage baseplate assembly protein W